MTGMKAENPRSANVAERKTFEPGPRKFGFSVTAPQAQAKMEAYKLSELLASTFTNPVAFRPRALTMIM